MKAANRGQGPLTAHACLARAVLVLASLARALGAQGKHTFANQTCARAPIKHAHVRQSNVRQSNMRTCAQCARAARRKHLRKHTPDVCANTWFSGVHFKTHAMRLEFRQPLRLGA
jgi:hypothetical protein